MATRKVANKKKDTVPASMQISDRILVIRTEVVPVADLHLYYKNPRIGDVDGIAESLQQHGQFRPILVNIGTHTGRPNEILAGNHTYLGARKLGWDGMYASFIDVDDETAKKIVLADNRLADKGTYDDEILAELFASLPDVTGTGYDDNEVEDILARIAQDTDRAVEEVTRDIDERARIEEEMRKKQTFDGSELGEEPDPLDDPGSDDDDDDEDDPGVEGASDQLPGMLQFKPPEQTVFPGHGYFGIPKLRKDMLMTFDDLPDTLETWAGSASKDDDDPDRWWLYNWGIDSTSGMKQPKSQVIVSFYAYDHYFENWWSYPDRYMAKLINSGIKFMVTPDWSQPTPDVLPRVEALYNLYRSRWVGRYAQECGVKVVPDVTWVADDMTWLEKYTLDTLPKNPPLIALQLQTIGKEPEKDQPLKDQVKFVFDHLKPEAALIYAGRPGREFIESLNVGVPLKILDTRQNKLSAHQKGREKKITI